jgi:hypothetical protein
MGCGASSPQAAPAAPVANTPAAASTTADPPGAPTAANGGLRRSTGGRDSAKERNAQRSATLSVKKAVGLIPVFYLKSFFDQYDTGGGACFTMTPATAFVTPATSSTTLRPA